MKRFSKILVVLILSVCILTPVSYAQGVYNTYTYNYWGEPRLSPDGYKVSKIVSGSTIGIKELSDPQDMYIDPDGSIYIADTGNNRIVVLNKELTFRSELNSFTVDGAETTLKNPTGVFVTKDKKLLIVDSDNKRVLRSDMNRKVDVVYKQPDSESFEFTGIDYIPLHVLADDRGYVYILCKDMYQGTMMYEENGTFVSYFGGNKTEVTFEIITNMFYKKFMTREQRSKIKKAVPVGIANFDIDQKGFIYTCTAASGTATDQVRKINPKGVSVLPKSTSIQTKYQSVFGDLESKWANGRMYETKMIDVVYDSEGFINCLDETRGRIFQYDNDSNLIFAFGGIGNQEGTFQRPVAVEAYDGKLYVLDCEKNNITVFEKTAYCHYVHDAILLYGQGKYTESEQYWNQVLKLNRNYTLTYIGLGKIKFEQQDYKAAMKYFKMGEDRSNYGRAYKQYRNIFLRSFILQLIIFVFVAGVLLLILKKTGTLKRFKNWISSHKNARNSSQTQG